MTTLRRYAPSFITVLRRANPIELLGLLLALLGLTTRIEPPVFWLFDPRECRGIFEAAIRFETSSSSISTVVYPPIGALSQFPVFIMVASGEYQEQC
jgi:hypothetical protein